MAGLVTGTVRAVAMAEAARGVIHRLALTYIVASAAPSNLITADEERGSPVTVNTKAAPPWFMLFGASREGWGSVPGVEGVVGLLESPHPRANAVGAVGSAIIGFFLMGLGGRWPMEAV